MVSEVIVYGRSDCCNNLYLLTWEVWLGEEVGAPNTAVAYQCGSGTTGIDQDLGAVHNVPCGGREGTVVTLLLPGSSRTIMISELLVLGYVGVR